jgi:hypothetical protein
MKHEGGARIGRAGGIASGFMEGPSGWSLAQRQWGPRRRSECGKRIVRCAAATIESLRGCHGANGKRGDERWGQWAFPGEDAGPSGQWGGEREFCMSLRETATVEWAMACARGEDAEMARTAWALAKCSMVRCGSRGDSCIAPPANHFSRRQFLPRRDLLIHSATPAYGRVPSRWRQSRPGAPAPAHVPLGPKSPSILSAV